MGFAELLAAVALFVGTPWAVFTGIAKVKAAGAAGRGGGEGTELRASELRRMIEASVEEATAPLVRRIETLEAIAVDDEPRPARVAEPEPARAGRLDPTLLDDAPARDAEADGAPARARARS